jgi:type I restriction enzyme, S subunit
MMKNKKPAVRFKGFLEEWEEKTLGEVGELKNGMNFGKEAMGHGYPFVNLQDVFGKSVVDSTKLGLAVSNENQRKDYSLQKGDVLFIRSSVKPEGVGETSIVIENLQNTTYSGFIIRFRPNLEMSENFNCFVFSTSNIRNQILSNATSSANTNINQDSLKKIRIALPHFQEQTQIGNFFKNLDNFITLHQHKYDKLVVLKKAMLEKMFPRNGAAVPEIRFKGFSGDWVERKLGEVCVMGDIDHRMPPSVTDGIPYVMTGNFIGINGIDFENSKLISIEDYEQLAKKIKPEIGDILFARYASVGAVRYVETQMKFLVSYSCAILKQNNTFDSRYLFYYLQSKETQRQIELEINTGSQRNIGTDSLKKLIILLPEEKEQTQIGNYFKNLDHLLTLRQGELEKLKNLKKALLEKMFV